MIDRPLRLGPDPNRSHLERWNEMHPDRYGRPDAPAEAEDGRRRWLSSEDADNCPGNAPPLHGFLDSLLSLAVLIMAPLTGAIATLLIYRWTAPGQLSIGWALGYAGLFLVTTWIGAMLVYALRRLLLAAVIAGATLGIGYLAWNLWLV